MRPTTPLILGTALALIGCSQQAEIAPMTAAQTAYADALMVQLLDAAPGDIITIPPGTHRFDRSLSLTVDGVTLRGAGMGESVLDFSGQVAGAEGLVVTASDFTIEDLAIVDTVGDALKINEGDNITIRRVRTEWTGGPKTENGAYGLYPVQTTNVLIEGCVAIGASDAGIYVGQSKQVVVRDNRVEYNVAGIEIENTQHADVYGNVATNNTGGILVFNMPNLMQYGSDVRVFGNRVFANNTKNFGHAGTPVASVPAGSGVLVNSHDRIEIFDNDISDNRTANVLISSVYSSNYADSGLEPGYDPYPEQISVHSNRYSGGGDRPDGIELKALKTMMFGLGGRFPDVIWDGYGPADTICVTDSDDVLNVDMPNGNDDPRVETGMACELEPLNAVSLAQAS